jgi:hypothetical protein
VSGPYTAVSRFVSRPARKCQRLKVPFCGGKKHGPRDPREERPLFLKSGIQSAPLIMECFEIHSCTIPVNLGASCDPPSAVATKSPLFRAG